MDASRDEIALFSFQETRPSFFLPLFGFCFSLEPAGHSLIPCWPVIVLRMHPDVQLKYARASVLRFLDLDLVS